MLITFEGPHGVGKTTIIEAVARQLRDKGFNILQTKEPTKSPLGEFLRNAEEFYDGECLACIAAADRYLHIKKEIVPALLLGKTVLSDRYVESSLVLQRLDGCSLEFLWNIHSQILIPELSVILVARPSTLDHRITSERTRLSRFERNGSREKEVSFYREAAEFVAQKGFNVLLLENGIHSIKGNSDLITHEILKLYQKKEKET